MPITLVLAETPAQGRDYVAGLDDNFTKNEGYYLGQKFIVTWALGPLVEIEEPEGYDPKYKNKDFSTLPILPEKVRYRLKRDEAGKYKKQFATIKKLLGREDVESIVIGTDPDREGELVARLILLLAENRKPVYRYWSSKPLTPEAIRTGFKSLKNATVYDPLYNAAQAKQIADWLIGINGSRAYSIKLHSNYPVGRVQTPALALICKREEEITNFASQEYWQIRVRFIHENGYYDGVWVDKKAIVTGDMDGNADTTVSYNDHFTHILSKEKAEQIIEDIEYGDGLVLSCETSRKISKPPLLFSLNSLQQEANRAFGFPADQTKKIALSLYETHKLISYPQPDMNYLHPDSATDVSAVHGQLSGQFPFSLEKCEVSDKNKRVFNALKATEHHALVPTGSVPEAGVNLALEEENIFEMIVRRFFATFYPDYEAKTTTVVTEIANHHFISTFNETVTLGWKELTNTSFKDSHNPGIIKSDIASVYEVELGHDKTSPPERYTDATLLEAMANIHNFVEGKGGGDLKRTISLGTPATQASTISKLMKAEYIIRKGKSLIPLEKGMRLIRYVGNDKIADPVYSAEWETELERVANGEVSSTEPFLTSVRENVIELIEKARTISQPPSQRNGERNSFGRCPACGEGEVFEGKKSFYCSAHKSGCAFKIWKSCMKRYGKEELSPSQVKNLIAGDKVRFNGLKSPRNGNKFNSEGVLKHEPQYGWGVSLAY